MPEKIELPGKRYWRVEIELKGPRRMGTTVLTATVEASNRDAAITAAKLIAAGSIMHSDRIIAARATEIAGGG